MTPGRAAVRVAILGTAHVHLPDYLEVIAQDPDTELAAVYGGLHPYRTEVAGHASAPTAAQALAGVDAALIASTTAEHDALLRQAVGARVPVLVEKPLGASVRDTARLCAVIADGVQPTTTAMFLRCAPALRQLRALLDRKTLGTVSSVHARFTHAGLLEGIFSGSAAWMLTSRHGAAGGFADLAVHLVDLLGWLDPAADIQVRGAQFCYQGGLTPNVGGAALLSWGGAPVSLHAGWQSHPGGVSVRIEGTSGTAAVDGGRLLLTTQQGEDARTYPAPRAGTAFEAFLGQIRGHHQWEAPTGAEILRTARILAAIDRAGGDPPA